MITCIYCHRECIDYYGNNIAYYCIEHNCSLSYYYNNTIYFNSFFSEKEYDITIYINQKIIEIHCDDELLFLFDHLIYVSPETIEFQLKQWLTLL